jgi:hypothetical protein
MISIKSSLGNIGSAKGNWGYYIISNLDFILQDPAKKIIGITGF